MDDSTLVKKAYLENVSENTNWAKTIQLLNVKLRLHENPLMGDRFAAAVKTNISTQYTEYWKTSILQSPRLDFYRKIKYEFEEEPYLQHHFRSRQLLAKLRCSNHYLEIEKARHNRFKEIPREQRICKICKQNKPEDEWHFLFECPGYNKIRRNHLGNPTCYNHASKYSEAYLSLPSTNLAKYIKEALALRDEIKGSYRVSWTSLSGMQIRLTKTNKKVVPIKNPLGNLQSRRNKDDLRITISRKEKKKQWKSILNPGSLTMVIRCLNPSQK
jgi:hypothetical protein